MNYINPNNLSVQSTPAPGLLEFPDEFMPIFYPDGKRAAGFVKTTDDGQKVTSCVWDEEAYQAWCDENPEQPTPEPVLTLEERVDNVEKSKADQTAVDELNEALHMILSGVTE